jgi:hypothetical protein
MEMTKSGQEEGVGTKDLKRFVSIKAKTPYIR